MKKKIIITAIALGLFSYVGAQERVWTMEECMQYAVDNSPKVKKQIHSYDTDKAEYRSAVGSFFPYLELSTSASYNFGRTIDLQTNTYTTTTLFGTSHYIQASLPVFDGGQVINQWQLAKVNRQLGMTNIQKEKDDLALKVLQAYVDVVYNQGLVQYATEKLEASRRNLYQTSRQEELGLKGRADVVILEAEVAGDDYLLTNTKNKYNTSISTLKELMNYPVEEDLRVDTTVMEQSLLFENESVLAIYDIARVNNPIALGAEYDVKAKTKEHLIQKGKMFPTISLYGGMDSRYGKDMKSDDPQDSFKDQFKNNLGEYVGLRITIPLFNKLNTITNVRRARNNLRIAQESRTEILRQLQTAIEKSVLDREGFAKEAIQMEKKRISDEYSYKVTLRKFEEGLMSPLDVQTSANILLESKANLLQRKLMFLLKCKEVDYYKGVPLIIIND